jgi:oligoendopeptidase F
MQYQSRDQIPEKYRWDLSSMCADDKDFERQLEDAKALPAKLAAYKGRVSTSSADLLAYLQLLDEASVTLSRLGNYADRQRRRRHPCGSLPGLLRPGHEP